MSYMQVALADGQSKIVGILGVKWNTILITRNKGKRKQEIPLLEFCKNSQRADQVNNIDSTCFSCWDDLSYGLNALGPLCLWQYLKKYLGFSKWAFCRGLFGKLPKNHPYLACHSIIIISIFLYKEILDFTGWLSAHSQCTQRSD